MTNQFLTADNPGVLSLVVDKQRFGFLNIGISAGGPADTNSCMWANYLAGNNSILPCIETIGDNALFTFSGDCVVAVTGGSSHVSINNVEYESWQNFHLKSGDSLKILNSDLGIRHYLAIHGGLAVTPIFGSGTTVTRDKLGGANGDGKAVSAKDQLFYNKAAFPWTLKAPKDAIPQYQNSFALDLVQGYQIDQFAPVQIQQFYINTYRILPSSSRMAARFDGQPIVPPNTPILSEGIAKGALQVPPDGVPIVMLSDRQTVGGYHKLGSVTSHASNQLAQAKIGTEINFNPIDIHLAHNQLLLAQARTQRWLRAVYDNKH